MTAKLNEAVCCYRDKLVDTKIEPILIPKEQDDVQDDLPSNGENEIYENRQNDMESD